MVGHRGDRRGPVGCGVERQREAVAPGRLHVHDVEAPRIPQVGELRRRVHRRPHGPERMVEQILRPPVLRGEVGLPRGRTVGAGVEGDLAVHGEVLDLRLRVRARGGGHARLTMARAAARRIDRPRELGHVEDRQIGVGRDVLAQVAVRPVPASVSVLTPPTRSRPPSASTAWSTTCRSGGSREHPTMPATQRQHRSPSHQRLLQVERRGLYD